MGFIRHHLELWCDRRGLDQIEKGAVLSLDKMYEYLTVDEKLKSLNDFWSDAEIEESGGAGWLIHPCWMIQFRNHILPSKSNFWNGSYVDMVSMTEEMMMIHAWQYDRSYSDEFLKKLNKFFGLVEEKDQLTHDKVFHVSMFKIVRSYKDFLLENRSIFDR